MYLVIDVAIYITSIIFKNERSQKEKIREANIMASESEISNHNHHKAIGRILIVHASLVEEHIKNNSTHTHVCLRADFRMRNGAGRLASELFDAFKH